MVTIEKEKKCETFSLPQSDWHVRNRDICLFKDQAFIPVNSVGLPTSISGVCSDICAMSVGKNRDLSVLIVHA